MLVTKAFSLIDGKFLEMHSDFNAVSVARMCEVQGKGVAVCLRKGKGSSTGGRACHSRSLFRYHIPPRCQSTLRETSPSS